MDSRTLKIRELKAKLQDARNFILDIIDNAADFQEEGKHIKPSWLIKNAVRRLERTKE